MDPIYLLLLPFAGSVLAALLPTHARTAAAAWAALVSAAALAWVIALYPEIEAGQVLRSTHSWMPSAGINFVVRIDGVAWLFALLVTGIGTLVAIYARYYMSKEDPVPRFFSFFLAFMGAMLGIVLSGNLIQMVFFWELTSLFSFLLIGYWHHRKDARRGARMALTVTSAGGLALLAGMLILGHIVGSYDLDVVLAAGQRIRAHPLYSTVLVLTLLGAFTKSAQFPFHFWLPRAMAAPTPVSAYLHSATMVKAGIFLLARLWPVLAGTPEWFWLVSGAGLITLVVGAGTAMFQNDLKGLLAYSTVSHLGLITLLLGLDGRLAAVAAVFHVINHATFKASLFMAAGIVDHETGTRDIRRLSGLLHAMPITGTLVFVASAAMAGVPLLNGFLSKEMFFAETVQLTAAPWANYGLPIAATVAGVFTVVYSLRFAVGTFLGPQARDLPREPHEPVTWMRLPIDVLVALCLLVGIVPQWSVGTLLRTAAAPVVGGQMPVFSLVIWHGFTPPLLMSVIALIGGAIVYTAFRRIHATSPTEALGVARWLNGDYLYRNLLYHLDRASRAAIGALSTHRLQPQLLLLTLFALGVAGVSLWTGGMSWGHRQRLPANVPFALLWVLGCVCALAAARMAKFHRLAALILLGGVGLCVSLTFVWFSAPDLALTQLAVEVVTTILFLLGLRWLPKRLADQGPREGARAAVRRTRDLLVAAAAGGGLALVAYALMTRAAPQSIAPFFIDRALSEGGGGNVVNVMLVDFRGFDTLGEITVLAIVALTIYALLRRFRPPRGADAIPLQQRIVASDLVTDLVDARSTDPATGYLLVPATLARLLLPAAALVSAYLFLRGHNEPGGGFVAGLVLSIAFLTQYIVSGTQWVEAHFQLRVMRWIASGLLIVIATGLGAVWLGYPFLTSHTAHLVLPVVGATHVPSALFFDLGVFSVVVGSTLLILTALAHQSMRAYRQTPESTVTATTGPRKIE
jgi:multicomponent K+:H+ antiporter subunit A